MVGGSTPLNGEIILSLRKMKDVELVDGGAGQIVAQTGATLSTIQEEAARVGWKYGIDFSARESATIGGTIATNAGGNNVIRYGDTRKQIIGLEAVTATGDIVGDVKGLIKDNTGYYLPGFLAGSEGTLAVITRVRLRLWPEPEEKVVVLFGLHSVNDAIDLVEVFAHKNRDIHACEIFFQKGMDLVISQFSIEQVWDRRYSAYVLFEFAGAKGIIDRLNTGITSEILKTSEAVAIGRDQTDQARLWRYRELHTEAISTSGIPHKLDVTIPHDRLSFFLENVDSIVKKCDSSAKTFLFGHAADGNIHVNVVGPEPDNTQVDEAVMNFVADIGGSISAEHGIGRAKANYLDLRRSPTEISLFRALKKSFDPVGILNPGVMFTQ